MWSLTYGGRGLVFSRRAAISEGPLQKGSPQWRVQIHIQNICCPIPADPSGRGKGCVCRGGGVELWLGGVVRVEIEKKTKSAVKKDACYRRSTGRKKDW